MEQSEKNNWDRANNQGNNINYNSDEADEKYLRDEVRYADEQEEINPNKDADGYGSEAARSDHSHYDAGMGSRKGNNDSDNRYTSTRSRENLGGSSHGASGRSSGMDSPD